MNGLPEVSNNGYANDPAGCSGPVDGLYVRLAGLFVDGVTYV